MLEPGKTYPGATKRIAVNFQSSSDDDVDPTTVTFVLRSPNGVETSYVYGTDAALVQDSTGDYHIDVVPDMGGRWSFAWISTGNGKATRIQDSFLVQQSEFDGYSDEFFPAYSGPWWR